MRTKLFTSIATLMLVLMTTVTPLKVAAQSIVILAIAVIGIGEGETAEIYLARPGRGDSEFSPNAPGDTPIFTYVVTNTGDATCTQTIEGTGPTSAVFGLPIPTTTVSKGFGFVTFDDGEKIELGECFKNLQSQRVVIQVGLNRGYDLSETLPPGPLATQELGHSIYKSSTGETVASAVREVVPEGFVQTFPPPFP